MHKNKDTPPGWPIVSGIGCISEKASKLIDDYLRPFVTSLPSYVQDTRDLLKISDDIIVPAEAWLVTIEVHRRYFDDLDGHTRGAWRIYAVDW